MGADTISYAYFKVAGNSAPCNWVSISVNQYGNTPHGQTQAHKHYRYHPASGSEREQLPTEFSGCNRL